MKRWNHHKRLMLIPSHIKKKESTHSRFLLTSRQWEELSGSDSLMKSSRGLVWAAVGGEGETMEGTPSAFCLIWSFWRRRSFLKSLAFRHGGRAGSAPIPAPQEKRVTRKGEKCQSFPKMLARLGVTKTVFFLMQKTWPSTHFKVRI